MLAAVSLVPAPAMTAPRPSTASLTAANSFSFSSWVRVGASPVVPPTTRPSLPESSRERASRRACS